MAFDFMDWGSWGVGDFYQDREAELRAALESGEDFDSGWHGWKKEIQSMRVMRTAGIVVVKVSAAMDDFEDYGLINDCLWNGEELTDEQMEEICDMCLMDDEFTTETDDSCELPVNATFEDVVEAATEMLDACDRCLKDSYNFCLGTTLQALYAGDEDKINKLYNERKE